MDPSLIVGGAAVIGSAIASYMNSAQAAKDTAAERQRVADIYNKIKQPNFDPADLTPEDYQVVSSYVPQAAPYVEAIAPQTVKVDSADAMEGRNAQKSSLEGMLEMARNGKDPLSEIAQAKASRTAASNAQSARATLDAQMQRRGVGAGSGLAYAGNQAAISDAYNADALSGEQAAADAAQRRMQATTSAANLGSNIYGQESSLAEKNAGIMNDFNKWLRDSQQNYQNNRANTINSGMLTNYNTAQDVANKNTGLANAAKTNKQNLQQQQFSNQLAIANGQAGLSNNRVSDIANNTLQQNNAIGGLGSGVAKVAMYNSNQPAQTDPNKQKDPDPLRLGGT